MAHWISKLHASAAKNNTLSNKLESKSLFLSFNESFTDLAAGASGILAMCKNSGVGP
jgi:hypothetical protein